LKITIKTYEKKDIDLENGEFKKKTNITLTKKQRVVFKDRKERTQSLLLKTRQRQGKHT